MFYRTLIYKSSSERLALRFPAIIVGNVKQHEWGGGGEEVIYKNKNLRRSTIIGQDCKFVVKVYT